MAKQKKSDPVQAWRDAVKAWRSAAPRAGTLGARECIDLANLPLRDEAQRLLTCARALLKVDSIGVELSAALRKVCRILDEHRGAVTPGTDSAVGRAEQLVDTFAEVGNMPAAPDLPNITTRLHKAALSVLRDAGTPMASRDLRDELAGARHRQGGIDAKRLQRVLHDLRRHRLVDRDGRRWFARSDK